MAARGTHERVLGLLAAHAANPCATDVIDIGAGMGALSARLTHAGYRVQACDLYPEAFIAEGIECIGVDASGRLPFADRSADIALAVELVEHIEGHETLFNEAWRVLRPGGLFLFTTPNILSLKSRLSFLLTGYPYSFPPLDPRVADPVSQHITPFSLDRYLWRLRQSGFELAALEVDKYQASSRALAFLIPLIRLASRRVSLDSESASMQNSPRVLFGRKLFVIGRRPKETPDKAVGGTLALD
ncbi:MAG TPA: class I SAM-dependent methyltransferase [Gammaproteobacteria bacterium]|nr:class I SAM-dependent methyltransferase [Gammaproteobacteria bacterium]